MEPGQAYVCRAKYPVFISRYRVVHVRFVSGLTRSRLYEKNTMVHSKGGHVCCRVVINEVAERVYSIPRECSRPGILIYFRMVDSTAVVREEVARQVAVKRILLIFYHSCIILGCSCGVCLSGGRSLVVWRVSCHLFSPHDRRPSNDFVPTRT